MSPMNTPGDPTPDRRHFLRGLAGTTLALGAFNASAGMAHAAPASTALPGYFDVTIYGAKGDGKTDDAPAIQAAIDAASKHGGGVVWLPPRTYLIGSPLLITNQIILAGAGTGTPFGVNPHPNDYVTGNGSNLYVTSTEFIPLTINGRGTTVRDLAFYHKQPDPAPGWAPLPYKAAIYVYSDDVRLENLFLHNPTIGISSQNIGRLTINRVFGQPIKTGIRIDNAQDVVKVDNIHFWPFWSYEAPVQDYQIANGQAIESYRNDNPHFSNIFALGYHIGFLFGQSDHGVTSKFRIVNADNDICFSGIVIQGGGTTGQISNYTFQGLDAPRQAESGIHISADNVTLQGTNIRTTNCGANGIRAEGSGTIVALDNVWIQAWDQSGKGFPAIEAAAKGTTVSIGFNRIFSSGKSPQTGGVGTVQIAKLS